jgi:hypothetical protein
MQEGGWRSIHDPLQSGSLGGADEESTEDQWVKTFWWQNGA